MITWASVKSFGAVCLAVKCPALFIPVPIDLGKVGFVLGAFGSLGSRGAGMDGGGCRFGGTEECRRGFLTGITNGWVCMGWRYM